MADDPYAYLSGLSAHPDRAGDTSNLNPAFAQSLANAIRQARAAGLNVGLESGFREPGQTGSAYDAGGNSSHTYGLASDISGLDGPNGKATQQWARIAEANGLHNPYGIGNEKEFNHWQLPPQPLEQNPQLLASLKGAYATGNMKGVWNAYSGGGAGELAQGTTINSTPFKLPANAPMGMGNNNPLNIKYAPGVSYDGLVGPSTNTDQGDPQNVFKTPEAGWAAGYSLLNKKYGSGMTTPNQIIAGKGGWTPGNTQAAANVAKAAGIGPDDDIGFNDPAKAQKFMRALVTQEQGAAASAYPDTMIAGALGGSQPASGPIDPSIIARGGYSPPIPSTPGTTINSTPATAAAPAGVSQAQQTQLAQNVKKMLGLPDDDHQGQQQIEPSKMIGPTPQAHNVSPLLGAPQAYAQRMAALNQPMTWDSAPPGQMPGTGYGMQAQPSVYGTSLMSNLGRSLDPMWMNSWGT